MEGTPLCSWSSNERKEVLEDRYLSTQVSALISVTWTQKNLVAENKGREKVTSKSVSGG